MRLFQPSFQKLASMIDHLQYASSIPCMAPDPNPFTVKMGFASSTSDMSDLDTSPDSDPFNSFPSDNDTGSEFDSFNDVTTEELEII